jgi:very-short-patch-repair endonuclease
LTTSGVVMDQELAGAALLRNRMLQVIGYLDAVVSRSESPVRTLPADRSVRGSGVPDGLPGCELYPGEPWLRLVRVPDPPSVHVSQMLDAFVHSVRHDPSHEPGLNPGWEDLAVEAGLSTAVVAGQHEAWLEDTWRPWAERTRDARQVSQAFTSVRSLALQLERQESDFELVWGHGLIHGRVGGMPLEYPLVSTPIEVTVDPETGVLSVRPTGPTRLEMGALSGLPSQHLDDLLSMAAPGAVVGFDPLDDEARIGFFRRALVGLGAQPRVREAGASLLDPVWQADFWIDDTFALTLRPRFSNLRGFLADLREHAGEGGVLDFTGMGALSALLHDEPSAIDDPSDSPELWADSGQRLLMPLERNEDQEKIARELSVKKLVAVQGPPGTGKTHTIANLISHLVAHGKRVLVVAHKEEPLTEVRDKIPASLRDLSVSLLGSSATQVNQMQAAVRQLMAVGSSTEAPASRARVDRIAVELDQAVAKRGQIEASLRRLAARDRQTLELGGVSMRPLQIGGWLNGHPERSWLPDDFSHGTACPLTPPEIDELLRLARTTTANDRAEARTHLPGLDPVPDGASLGRAFDEMDHLRGIEQALTRRGLHSKARPHERPDFVGLAARAGALAESVARRPAWLEHLAASAANPQTRHSYNEQLAALQHDLDALASLAVPLAGHSVTIDPERVNAPREHLQALHRLQEELVGKGSVGLFARELQRTQRRNLIDGEPIRTTQDVALVVAVIRIVQLRHALALRWNQLASPHLGPPIATAYPEHEATRNLDALRRCVHEETDVWPQLRSDLEEAVTGIPETAETRWLGQVAAVLTDARALQQLDKLEAAATALETDLKAGGAQPDASRLWRAMQAALSGRLWGDWDDTLAEAARLRALSYSAARCDELSALLSRVAPKTVGLIAEGAGQPSTADELQMAWEWRDVRAWLDEVIGAEDAASLGVAASDARGEIRQLTEQLAEASARHALIVGMTDGQRRALSDWATAIGKIGKGTGKSAGHWTAIAQQKMQDAVEGVPVWIMSWQRALSQFRGGTTPFDVVIVDEASQCDIRSLLVLTLGRRAVVVGDDKQISPTSFVNVDLVRDLIDRHLKDVPSANFFEPSESLFNRAVSASNGALTLSEHFRCVPEIITFSSQRWYDGRIQPLRAGAGAFAHPFKVVHTPEGVRDSLTGYGNDVNKAEADALVDKVVELSSDDAYQDKTFGVISLLSSSKQDVYLQHQLLKRLGEREYARRRLKVGGAYAFQGAERHVMFVSLVVDSNKRFGAFTSLDDQRRVNVAASRAADQVWIFHSAELPEFSKDDVRRAWVEYASSGFDAAQQFGNLEDLCESGFERDVLRQVVQRGYLPIPQFKVGKYRIDFVIQLRNGSRIAIECDGDAYHQDLDADMARQAILERVGRCEFFRIRGSVFGRDPVGSLGPLWSILESRGAPRWQESDVSPLASAGSLTEKQLRTSDVTIDPEVTTKPTHVIHSQADLARTGKPAALAGKPQLLPPVPRPDENGHVEKSQGSPVAPAIDSDLPAEAAGLTPEQLATLQMAMQLGASLRLAKDGSVEIIPRANPATTVSTGNGTPTAQPLRTQARPTGPERGSQEPYAASDVAHVMEGAREEILSAARLLIERTGSDVFNLPQLISEMRGTGTMHSNELIERLVKTDLYVEGYVVRLDDGMFSLYNA